MPEKNLRRRAPVPGAWKTKLPHPSPPPGKRTTPPRRSNKQLSKPIRILKRCSSEPMLTWSDGGGDDQDQEEEQQKSLWLESEVGVFPETFSFRHVSVSSPSLTPPSLSPQNFEGYRKDAKVVVNVTVEGSPGPVRAMVRLGSNVEDTIKLVVDKYGVEGRTPKLDKDAASSYQLHQSYFSLQSLDRSELIGDVGGRSFYLRRSSSNRSCKGESFLISEIIPGRPNSPPPLTQPNPPPPFLLPPLIAGNLGKIVRRTRRLWKVFFCWQ